MHEKSRGLAAFLPLQGARNLVWLVAVLPLGCGSLLTFKFAVADLLLRQNSFASVARAVALDPGNASYHELLAEHLAEAGSDPSGELAAAVSLSPLDSHFWIRLAFQQESDGRLDDAEHSLNQAVAVDRTFGPKAAMTNYYFRRGDELRFWKWAGAALEMAYGGMNSIFRLCWLMSPDEAKTRLIMPSRHDVLVSYLYFLLERREVAAAGPIAVRAVHLADAGDVTGLLSYCDESIGTPNSSALDVWNTLCRRKLVPFETLDPAAGRIVSNGHFETLPTGRGYDWRTTEAEGLSFAPVSDGMELRLSGRQPGESILLAQRVPLHPGQQYRMTYTYRAIGAAVVSGLHWEVRTTASPHALLAGSPDLVAGEDWNTRHIDFNADDNDSAIVELSYGQVTGMPRWDGVAVLRFVSIEPIR